MLSVKLFLFPINPLLLYVVEPKLSFRTETWLKILQFFRLFYMKIYLLQTLYIFGACKLRTVTYVVVVVGYSANLNNWNEFDQNLFMLCSDRWTKNYLLQWKYKQILFSYYLLKYIFIFFSDLFNLQWISLQVWTTNKILQPRKNFLLKILNLLYISQQNINSWTKNKKKNNYFQENTICIKTNLEF